MKSSDCGGDGGGGNGAGGGSGGGGGGGRGCEGCGGGDHNSKNENIKYFLKPNKFKGFEVTFSKTFSNSIHIHQLQMIMIS